MVGFMVGFMALLARQHPKPSNWARVRLEGRDRCVFARVDVPEPDLAPLVARCDEELCGRRVHLQPYVGEAATGVKAWREG